MPDADTELRTPDARAPLAVRSTLDLVRLGFYHLYNSPAAGCRSKLQIRSLRRSHLSLPITGSQFVRNLRFRSASVNGFSPSPFGSSTRFSKVRPSFNATR